MGGGRTGSRCVSHGVTSTQDYRDTTGTTVSVAEPIQKDARPTHTRRARRQGERGGDEVSVSTARNCLWCTCADDRTGLIGDNERQSTGVRGHHAVAPLQPHGGGSANFESAAERRRGRGQKVLQMNRQGCRQGLPGIRCQSVVWPSDFATKRPAPSDVATLGVLDVHTAVRPTFTEFALSRQTTVSPASSVGALHTRVSPIPDEGALGAVGATLPHAVAIDSATLRAIVRLLAMARTSYQSSHTERRVACRGDDGR